MRRKTRVASHPRLILFALKNEEFEHLNEGVLGALAQGRGRAEWRVHTMRLAFFVVFPQVWAPPQRTLGHISRRPCGLARAGRARGGGASTRIEICGAKIHFTVFTCVLFL